MLFAPAPYAIAFSIDELLLAHSWVRQRGLRLTVATDQVRNESEFEEMLVIAAPGQDSRSVSIWRTHQAVFAQRPGRRPFAFDSLNDLLAALHPAGPRREGRWRRWLDRMSATPVIIEE